MVFNMVLDRGGTRLKGEVLSAKVTGQNFEEGELCSYSPPGWEWNHDSGFDSNRPVRGIALDDDTYMQVCNNHSARYAVMIRKSTGERSTPVLISSGEIQADLEEASIVKVSATDVVIFIQGTSSAQGALQIFRYTVNLAQMTMSLVKKNTVDTAYSSVACLNKVVYYVAETNEILMPTHDSSSGLYINIFDANQLTLKTRTQIASRGENSSWDAYQILSPDGVHFLYVGMWGQSDSNVSRLHWSTFKRSGTTYSRVENLVEDPTDTKKSDIAYIIGSLIRATNITVFWIKSQTTSKSYALYATTFTLSGDTFSRGVTRSVAPQTSEFWGCLEAFPTQIVRVWIWNLKVTQWWQVSLDLDTMTWSSAEEIATSTSTQEWSGSSYDWQQKLRTCLPDKRLVFNGLAWGSLPDIGKIRPYDKTNIGITQQGGDIGETVTFVKMDT